MVAVGLVAGLGAGGCGDDGGDPEAFCAQAADIGGLAGVIEGYASAEPQALARRTRTEVNRYERLAEVAPAEIRGEVNTLRDAVRLILNAVEAHPNDDDALRAELAEADAELNRAGEAALAVSTYAEDECGVDLDGG